VTPATATTICRTGPGHFEKLDATTALGRTSTPEQAAAVYVALVLDLTAGGGQSLVVDAGQTSHWR